MRASTGWLGYALLVTGAWGIWGAFTGVPSQNGFPDTLTYIVWSLTMVPPALWALRRTGWSIRRDGRSIALGVAIGGLGAAGQLVLFHAVTIGPAYLIFPIVSLSPAVTIVLSCLLLGERTGRSGLLGILLAVLSLPLFDYSPGEASHFGLWFVLSLAVMLAWGVQAYFIKVANATMDAESIFVYMAATALLLAPGAWLLTDFSQPVYLGLGGPYLAALIQILNAVGALLLVYAFRYGKAIVVSPLVNAGAPLLTTVISLSLAGSLPGPYKLAAALLALSGAALLALQTE